MSFQIQLKRHEIFSVNLYLIGYQQFLLHQVILINEHLTKICCFAVKFLITKAITLLICPSLGRVEGRGRAIKYRGWGMILVTVKTTIKRCYPLPPALSAKEKLATWRAQLGEKARILRYYAKFKGQIKPRDPIHSYTEANNCNRQLKSKTKKRILLTNDNFCQFMSRQHLR